MINVYGGFSHCKVICGALVPRICYFTIINMRKDPEARRAVLLLISRGLISVHEARLLAGVSRQLVHGWCRSKGINPTRARQQRIVRAFRKALAEP